MVWIGAMIEKLSKFLSELGQLYGYQATYGLSEGIAATVEWTMDNSPESRAERAKEAESWFDRFDQQDHIGEKEPIHDEEPEVTHGNAIGAKHEEDKKDDQEQTGFLGQ
jgi:hypothetical protein